MACRHVVSPLSSAPFNTPGTPVSIKPFDQTIDEAQQEEEDERADYIWKMLGLQECKKSFASSTKIDFMRLLKELE
jgi:hypothetical protein